MSTIVIQKIPWSLGAKVTVRARHSLAEQVSPLLVSRDEHTQFPQTSVGLHDLDVLERRAMIDAEVTILCPPITSPADRAHSEALLTYR
jgi:hypothetical protein